MHFVSRQCAFTTLGVGLLCTGLLLAIALMDIFYFMLSQEMALTRDSKTFKLWKKPPIKLYFDVYLYNWTNPCNFTDNEFEKPIVEEIGPYRFREVADKTDIRFHANHTVSYRRRSSYYFVEEESNGRLNDIITTVNVVALSAAAKARTWSYLRQKQVSVGLSLYKQQVYVTKEAREFLFDGYQDDLIDMAREMARFDPAQFAVPYDRFGWFYQRNESKDVSGHFNMHTGVGEISQIGLVKKWNYKPKIDSFEGACNEVRGSGGEFYSPDQSRDDPVSLFNGEMCRPLDLYYTEDINVDGLNLYKYSATERSVDNGTKYPETDCYSIGEKVPSGAMNVSACRYGAPVFISFPHFYNADPSYLEYVDGMHAEKEIHEFYMALEPMTGIPVEVAARLQANVLIQPVPNIALYQDAPYMFFPMIWFEQKVKIPDALIADVKTAVIVPVIGYSCAGCLIAFGGIILLFLHFQKKRNTDDTEKSKCAMKTGKVVLEDSPLMNEKHAMHKAPIQVRSRMAPIATIENDTEFAEKESIMMPQ